MKRLIIAVLCTLALPVASSFAAAQPWKIDSDHAQVGFKVRHLMVANVRGNFDKVSGVVDLDETDLAKSVVRVTIETSSINTGIAKRDDHLRSADFLDVGHYPSMTFVSRKVVKKGPESLQVTGDLTIRGVTKSVVLDVEGPTAAIKDPWGSTRRGASASTRINRKDFGLTWNRALETGGVAVGDEVEIMLDVEMIRQ